jgi:hypothetical protein
LPSSQITFRKWGFNPILPPPPLKHPLSETESSTKLGEDTFSKSYSAPKRIFYMNSNIENNHSRWERWGTAAFYSYCLCTIFMIFFSTSAIQIWPYPWNRLSMLVACFVPLTLVSVWKIPILIRDKKLEKQFLFIPIIIILGILNIIFSEDRPTTLKVMALFLISGIGIFVATSCLLNTKFRQTIFLWLCWACIFALCVYGTLEYINKKPILFLS